MMVVSFFRSEHVKYTVPSAGYATFQSGRLGLTDSVLAGFGLGRFGLGCFGLETFRSDYENLQKSCIFTMQTYLNQRDVFF